MSTIQEHDGGASILANVPPVLHDMFTKAALDRDWLRALGYVDERDRIEAAEALLSFIPRAERPAMRAQIAKWKRREAMLPA